MPKSTCTCRRCEESFESYNALATLCPKCWTLDEVEEVTAKSHYDGNMYFLEYKGTFYIPTCAGDIQTAQDDYELFTTAQLKELQKS